MKLDRNLLGTAALRLHDSEEIQTSAPASSADSPEMVFVTGASRSGTSMLARMLGAHSEIMDFDELHFFGDLYDPYASDQAVSPSELSELAATLKARHTQGLWGGRPTEVERAWGRWLVRNMPNDQFSPAQLLAAVTRQIAKDAGKSIACEQTPRNIFYAERLFELYPTARIVHIVRDPRAVLASQKNRWKLRRMGAQHLPVVEMLRNRVNYHPITMGQLWTKAQSTALRLIEHPRFMSVRFEDLAADSEECMRRLSGFLGLNFEPEMLVVPRWGSSNVQHSTDIKGVSAEVLDQWRSSLSDGEVLLNEKMTHRMMEKFGYQPEFMEKVGNLSALPSLLKYPLHVAGVIATNPRRALVQLAALGHAKYRKKGR